MKKEISNGIKKQTYQMSNHNGNVYELFWVVYKKY